jgi:branched-chain amino acid transport system substrate-binding protein
LRRSTLIKLVAPGVALALVLAACGDDDDAGGGDAAGAATTAAAATTAGGADTTAASSDTTGTASTDESASPSDATTGTAALGGGTGSADKGPFKLGVINSNDLFPDYAQGIEAAVGYVNAELNGLDGRKIELQICTIDYNAPDDTQRCANELAAAGVDMAVSTLNQFGTHMQILRGAGIPVLVGSAVSVPDYTTEGVFAVSPGGGCAGTLTAMVKYAVQELGAKRVAIPYYDIPSGVLCYADSEQKPLDVLKGTAESSSPDAGSVPDLERKGVPLPPTNPDLTSVANQILQFDPDVVLLSAPATVCFPLLAALNSVGYSVENVPFVMGSSCFDQASATDAGANAEGIYFVGSAGYLTRDPSTLEGAQAAEASLYQEKAVQYGLDQEFLTRNFAQQGFTLVMSLSQRAAEVAAAGEPVDGATLAAAFAATEDAPQFGSSPISCATAPAPYVAICNRNVNVTQWNGTEQLPIESDYYAMDLLDGTEIRTAPVD